ncbi:hypothetical protein K490DRAFT_60010 [Saccharata proteae CBS 121410]|uniref:Uncharacterized protein n=1 Tax=Saccharata proteae CBS 121410 TaxID=1314787 RepID=A0A9P4HLV1_9PEZI|nr:hypothetical protein K490DRAFT_60010 [Saccharata proteae CBS 121410]
MDSHFHSHPDLFLTFRVLQLTRRELEQDAVQGLESCSMSRKIRTSQHRISKSQRCEDYPSRTWCPRKAHDEGKKYSHYSLDRLVNEVNKQFSRPMFVPSKAALDHSLFLACKSEPDFGSWSLLAIVRALGLVNTTLASIRSSQSDEELLLCQGNEVANTNVWDENFLGNLEHILLVLRQALVEAFIRKSNLRPFIRRCLEALREEAKQEQKYWRLQRKLLSWFSEYAGGRPLSTTWPWSIRPSLAVLWGDCWMFYPYEDGGHAYQPSSQWTSVQQSGRPGGSGFAESVAGYLLPQWLSPQADEYETFGRELTGLGGGGEAGEDEDEDEYMMAEAAAAGASSIFLHVPELPGGSVAEQSRPFGFELPTSTGIPNHVDLPQAPSVASATIRRLPRDGSTAAAAHWQQQQQQQQQQLSLSSSEATHSSPHHHHHHHHHHTRTRRAYVATHPYLNPPFASPPNALASGYSQPQAPNHSQLATQTNYNIDALLQQALPPYPPAYAFGQQAVTLSGALPTVTAEAPSPPIALHDYLNPPAVPSAPQTDRLLHPYRSQF